jgi:hypothetical protein
MDSKYKRRKKEKSIVEKSSSYCWAINEQWELCLSFFPDENFLSHETSLMLNTTLCDKVCQ